MIMANLAMTYKRQSRLKEAEELAAEALGGKKKFLGDEHPKTLSSMIQLAIMYHH